MPGNHGIFKGQGESVPRSPLDKSECAMVLLHAAQHRLGATWRSRR